MKESEEMEKLIRLEKLLTLWKVSKRELENHGQNDVGEELKYEGVIKEFGKEETFEQEY